MGTQVGVIVSIFFILGTIFTGTVPELAGFTMPTLVQCPQAMQSADAAHLGFSGLGLHFHACDV